MNNSEFLWLIEWYQVHCNGDWEHGRGIQIGTIDNPGWSLTVELEDTELENKMFLKIVINRSDRDWIICFIKDNAFEGRGGVNNLPEILKIFKDWATTS